MERESKYSFWKKIIWTIGRGKGVEFLDIVHTWTPTLLARQNPKKGKWKEVGEGGKEEESKGEQDGEGRKEDRKMIPWNRRRCVGGTPTEWTGSESSYGIWDSMTQV